VEEWQRAVGRRAGGGGGWSDRRSRYMGNGANSTQHCSAEDMSPGAPPIWRALPRAPPLVRLLSALPPYSARRLCATCCRGFARHMRTPWCLVSPVVFVEPDVSGVRQLPRIVQLTK